MANRTSRKKLFFATIKIGLSATILGWLYYQARQEDQFSEIAAREKNWHWLILALMACLMAHVISFYRWKVLVRALDIPFTTRDAIRIGFIGAFFGYVFLLGVVAGDSLRVFYVARDAREKIAEVICTVFADRAIGMLTMFTFASIGFLVLGMDFEGATNQEKVEVIRFLCRLVVTATAMGWLVVAAFLLSPKIESSRLVIWLQSLPKIGRIIVQLADVVRLYRRQLGTLAKCFGLSLLVNFCLVATIYLIPLGINVQHPALSKHFLMSPISMAANAVPLPMGGMELMLSYFYDAMSIVGSESNYGIVVAFTFRFMLLMLAAIGAIAWFANRRQIVKTVERPEIADWNAKEVLSRSNSSFSDL